jgi:hypothetical protein
MRKIMLKVTDVAGREFYILELRNQSLPISLPHPSGMGTPTMLTVATIEPVEVSA